MHSPLLIPDIDERRIDPRDSEPFGRSRSRSRGFASRGGKFYFSRWARAKGNGARVFLEQTQANNAVRAKEKSPHGECHLLVREIASYRLVKFGRGLYELYTGRPDNSSLQKTVLPA